MTKEEARAYAQKLTQDMGASPEETAVILKAFDNDKFAHGFVPRPEVDRSLDRVKSEFEPFKQQAEYYEKDWYPKAKLAYETNLRGIATLDKYRQRFGDLNPDDPAEVRKLTQATGLTKEEVRELMDKEMTERLGRRDRATLELMNIREQHMDTFKKRLDVAKFEKFVEEQQKTGEFTSLKGAYRDFVEPEQAATSEASLAERIKRERAEAVQDFASRNKIPSDPKPREAHLLYDRETLKKEAAKENGMSAREEFLGILRDPDPDTIKQRYPTA